MFTTAGLYRLKFLSSGCDKVFYFRVITGGLLGSLFNKKGETPLEQDSIGYQLSANGVQYKVEVYRNSTLLCTDTKTDNIGIIKNLTEGTYCFKFTLPQTPDCRYAANEIIDEQADMRMTAVLKGFKERSCNTAKLQLKIEAEQPTYRFYVRKIDGQGQCANETAALGSAPTGIQLASQGAIGADIKVPNITRVGEYEFIVGD